MMCRAKPSLWAS